MEVVQLVSKEKIDEVVGQLADRIRRDYEGREPLLIGCLTGSFVFMADLVRRIGAPVECDFMKVSSYESRTTPGELRLLLDHMLPVEGRDVIVVEDIVDTGASLSFVRERIAARKPASLSACVLLYKESLRARIRKGEIEYLGLSIPDVFIVGYGIDYAQRHRELPYIGVVEK